MKVDFHIHSTNSDGTLSPNELVKYIDKKGVSFASITDHNRVTHINSNVYQCRMILGVEVTTYIGEKIIHILGYNFIENSELKNMLSYICKIFRNLPIKILHMLRSKGLDINLGSVIKSHDLIRSIAEKLVSEKHAASVEEAYHAYINNEYNKILLQFLPSADVVIKVLNSAQGISVLAHPTQYWTEIESTINCISQLISYGLNGIECYHPSI